MMHERQESPPLQPLLQPPPPGPPQPMPGSSSLGAPYASHKPQMNGQERGYMGGAVDEFAFSTVPSNDQNEWYYPYAQARNEDEDEEPMLAGRRAGNWGNKTQKGARWVRRGKMVAWGPGHDRWEAEEMSRKRLKSILPKSRSSSPYTLPHLRSPSPPVVAPFPAPEVHHASFSSFVLDPAINHSFRSNLLMDLEYGTASLIEGESTMRRALRKLWQVLSEDPDVVPEPGLVRATAGMAEREREEEGMLVAKREEGMEDVDDDGDVMELDVGGRVGRPSRAPDLTDPMHKLFLTFSPRGRHAALGSDQHASGSHMDSPQQQLERLEKSIVMLRELEDDGREYVERLEEIREGLGDLRTQRDLVWTKVREHALRELQEISS